MKEFPVLINLIKWELSVFAYSIVLVDDLNKVIFYSAYSIGKEKAEIRLRNENPSDCVALNGQMGLIEFNDP